MNVDADYQQLYGDIDTEFKREIITNDHLRGLKNLLDIVSVQDKSEDHFKKIEVVFVKANSLGAIRLVKKIIDEFCKKSNFLVYYANLKGNIFNMD